MSTANPLHGLDDGTVAVGILFVDLDGTVRHGRDELGRWVNTPDDVVIFDEAAWLIGTWCRGGGRVVGITNQAGPAMGHADEALVIDAICRTIQLVNELDPDAKIEIVEMCNHHPDLGCFCRKPAPGLAFEAIGHLRATYPEEVYLRSMSLMVGDLKADADFAEALGIPFMRADAWRAMPRWLGPQTAKRRTLSRDKRRTPGRLDQLRRLAREHLDGSDHSGDGDFHNASGSCEACNVSGRLEALLDELDRELGEPVEVKATEGGEAHG